MFILNLSIYLAIVKAGKLEVTNSFPGKVEMLRRNISTGSSSSSGSRTGKTQGCEMRTEIMTRGDSFATTHLVTHKAHKNRNASINTSDMYEVCPHDCVLFKSIF